MISYKTETNSKGERARVLEIPAGWDTAQPESRDPSIRGAWGNVECRGFCSPLAGPYGVTSTDVTFNSED